MARLRDRKLELDQQGWTLVELLTVLVIFGILISMTMDRSQRAMLAARNAQAAVEIMEMQTAIDDYEFDNDALPGSLAAVGHGGKLDPWGRAYVYAIITDITMARKDKFLVPLNTGYDLYSLGADGITEIPLTAPPSHDDIVRGSDGGYVGLASGY